MLPFVYANKTIKNNENEKLRSNKNDHYKKHQKKNEKKKLYRGIPTVSPTIRPMFGPQLLLKSNFKETVTEPC